MKDIYELLNDINIDENEFEEMEVNEIEKAKVKNALKKSIDKKKKLKGWKTKAVAASILVCISATTFGLTFPAYAKTLPVIDDIFRFFNDRRTGLSDVSKEKKSTITKDQGNGLYYDYKKFSNEINLTQESNGIKFTINDAVFDGKTVTLTYSIESQQELGNAGIGMPKIRGVKAMGGTGKTSKIDTNKYVGILTASNMEDNKLAVANIQWNIDSIKNPDNGTVIKGDWKFAFSLNATNSNIKFTEGSTEKNGVKVNISKVSFNPMSFIVYYDQEVSEMVKNKWDGVIVDLEIKDDLGNIYSGADNGGMGPEGSYHISGSKTFEKLDPNAKELIITPHITLTEYNSSNYASVTITPNEDRKIPLPKKPGVGQEKFVSEDIHIKLKK